MTSSVKFWLSVLVPQNVAYPIGTSEQQQCYELLNFIILFDLISSFHGSVESPGNDVRGAHYEFSIPYPGFCLVTLFTRFSVLIARWTKNVIHIFLWKQCYELLNFIIQFDLISSFHGSVASPGNDVRRAHYEFSTHSLPGILFSYSVYAIQRAYCEMDEKCNTYFYMEIFEILQLSWQQLQNA